MTRLEDLLQQFHDGDLDASSYEELLGLLQHPEARQEWVWNAMIQSAVRQAQQRDNPSQSTRHAIAVAASAREELPTSSRRIRLSPCSQRGKRHFRLTACAVGVAAALLLVAGAIHFFKGAERDDAHAAAAMIVELSGDAQIRSDGGTQPARAGLRLTHGSAVTTAANTLLRLSYPDETTVVLYGDSELVLHPVVDASQKHLRLERGGMKAAVTPQSADAPFVVETPFAAATVMGTEFSLSTKAGGSRLEVLEGRVRYVRASDGQSILVGKGEFADARRENAEPFTVQALAGEGAPAVDGVLLGTMDSPAEKWEFHPQTKFPGEKGALDYDHSFAKEGTHSLRLRADFRQSGKYVAASRNLSSGAVSETLAAIPDSRIAGIRFWVRSPAATGITLHATDATGQRHQLERTLQPGTEWQRVEFRPLAGGKQNSHSYQGGANDGVFHGPLRSITLLLKREHLDSTKTGEIWIDQIELIVDQDPARK